MPYVRNGRSVPAGNPNIDVRTRNAGRLFDEAATLHRQIRPGRTRQEFWRPEMDDATKPREARIVIITHLHKRANGREVSQLSMTLDAAWTPWTVLADADRPLVSSWTRTH